MTEEELPQDDQLVQRSAMHDIALLAAGSGVSELGKEAVKAGVNLIGKQVSENLQSLKGDGPPKDE
jgi:hypothetical protein